MSLVQLFPSLSSMTNMSITAPSCDINSAQHPLPCTYIGLCLFLRSNWCVWSNETRFDWNATLERQTAHFWTAPATHKNAVIGAAMVAAWCTSRMIHRSEQASENAELADPKILLQHVLDTDCPSESCRSSHTVHTLWICIRQICYEDHRLNDPRVHIFRANTS